MKFDRDTLLTELLAYCGEPEGLAERIERTKFVISKYPQFKTLMYHIAGIRPYSFTGMAHHLKDAGKYRSRGVVPNGFPVKWYHVVDSFGGMDDSGRVLATRKASSMSSMFDEMDASDSAYMFDVFKNAESAAMTDRLNTMVIHHIAVEYGDAGFTLPDGEFVA